MSLTVSLYFEKSKSLSRTSSGTGFCGSSVDSGSDSDSEADSEEDSEADWDSEVDCDSDCDCDCDSDSEDAWLLSSEVGSVVVVVVFSGFPVSVEGGVVVPAGAVLVGCGVSPDWPVPLSPDLPLPLSPDWPVPLSPESAEEVFGLSLSSLLAGGWIRDVSRLLPPVGTTPFFRL